MALGPQDNGSVSAILVTVVGVSRLSWVNR
jgi:hypothetical protein